MKKITKPLCFILFLLCINSSYAQYTLLSVGDDCYGASKLKTDSVLSSKGFKLESDEGSVTYYTKDRQFKVAILEDAGGVVRQVEMSMSVALSDFSDIAAELSSRSYPSMMSCLFWQTLVVLNQTDSLMFLDGTIGSMKASRMREDYVRGKIGKEQFEAFAQHYCGTQMTYSRFLNAMVEYMGATMIAQISETMTRGNSAWVVKADKKKKKILVKYIRSSESRESLQRQLQTE